MSTLLPPWVKALSSYFISLLVFFSTLSAQAQGLLVTDDFNYTTGSNLDGNSNWADLNGGPGYFTVNAPGTALAMTGYNGGGGNFAKRNLATNTTGRSRYTFAHLDMSANQRYFHLAFLLRVNSINDMNAEPIPYRRVAAMGSLLDPLSVTPTPAEFCRVMVTSNNIAPAAPPYANNKFILGLSKGATDLDNTAALDQILYIPTELDVNTTYLVVASYTYNRDGGGGTDDLATLRVYNATPRSPSATPLGSITIDNVVGFADHITAADQVNSVSLNNDAPTLLDFDLDGLRFAASESSELAAWRALDPAKAVRSGAAWANGFAPATATGEVVSVEVPTGESYNATDGDLYTNNTTVDGTLTIPAGKVVQVEGQLNYIGTVTVQSGGSLLQTTGSTLGTTSGTFTVLRNNGNSSSNTIYNHWGSPVEAAPANLLTGTSFRRRYTYHEPTAQWRNSDNGITANVSVLANPNFYLNPGNTLIPGVGYTSMRNSSQATVTFTGKPNNGNIAVNTSLLNGGSFAGLNLMGNPYPSAILINDGTGGATGLLEDPDNTAFEPSAYVFQNGNNNTGTGTYIVVNEASINKHVASGQGFFVRRTTSGSGNLTFKNEHRAAANNNTFYRGEATGIEHLSLIVRRADQVRDNVALALADNFTDAYENGRDARKMDANNELNLAAQWNGQRLAQVALAKNRGLEIPLVLNTTRTGEHTFMAENVPTATTLPLFLEDRATGEFYYLQAGREHKINLAAGTHEGRFFVRTINEAAQSTGAQAAGAQVFSYGRELFVRANGTGTLRMYNLMGVELWKAENVKVGGLARFTLQVPASGIYVVKYTDEQGSTEAKVWLE